MLSECLLNGWENAWNFQLPMIDCLVEYGIKRGGSLEDFHITGRSRKNKGWVVFLSGSKGFKYT